MKERDQKSGLIYKTHLLKWPDSEEVYYCLLCHGKKFFGFAHIPENYEYLSEEAKDKYKKEAREMYIEMCGIQTPYTTNILKK